MSSYSSDNTFWSPTPKIVKWLIALHLSMGLLCGFFNSLLGQKLNISFLKLFALSIPGLIKGWLWQPLSFIFIPEIEGSLNFYFLFTLCFDAYLLWLMGCRVQDEIGNKTFLKLFFLPAVLSSVFVLGTCYVLNIPCLPLYGLSYGILPLVVAYCFLNPRGQFNFFLPYPVRLRWVGLGLTALYLLQDLSNLNFIALSSHLFLLLLSHLYLVLGLRKKSPFSFTHRFDEFLLSLKKKNNEEKIIPLYESPKNKSEGIKKIFSWFNKDENAPRWKRFLLWTKSKFDKN